MPFPSSVAGTGTKMNFPAGDADPFADAPRGTNPPAAAPTPPAKPSEPVKPAEVAKPAEKPAGEAPKPGDKPPETPAPNEEFKSPSGAPAFSPKWYREHMKANNDRREAAEAKVKELETRLSTAQPAPEVDALTQTLASKDKTIQELHEKLGSLSFTESPEFKTKYVEPFNRAYSFATSRLKNVQVANADGTVRPATAQDFTRVYQTASNNVGEAAKLATEIFGDSANWVMSRVDELQRMQYEHDTAREGERAAWETQNKEKAAKQSQMTEYRLKAANQIHQDMLKRQPEIYGEDPQDPEGTELLKKGYQTADAYFVHRGTLTPQQEIVAMMKVRNDAAALPLALHRLNKKNDEIANLQATIAELRGSEPGAEEPKHASEAPAGAKKESMWDEMNRHIKSNFE